MRRVVWVLAVSLVWPASARAGLFGPSAGEEVAIILGVIFGIPALLVAVWLYFRARIKLAQTRARPYSNSETARFDIFLSYSATDRVAAQQVADLVQQAQLKLFFAQADLQAGSPFTEEIRTALNDSREVWVLATPSSIHSVWVATEWGTAWALQRRIVPILLDTTTRDLPDRLQALQAVKFEDLPEEIRKARARSAQGSDRNGKRRPLWKTALTVAVVVCALGWLAA